MGGGGKRFESFLCHLCGYFYRHSISVDFSRFLYIYFFSIRITFDANFWRILQRLIWFRATHWKWVFLFLFFSRGCPQRHFIFFKRKSREQVEYEMLVFFPPIFVIFSIFYWVFQFPQLARFLRIASHFHFLIFRLNSLRRFMRQALHYWVSVGRKVDRTGRKNIDNHLDPVGILLLFF